MSLIDPAHFPTINTSTIEPAEAALKKWGANLLDDVEALRVEWRKLWSCYHAPEQDRVYALQDPAVESAQDIKSDFDAAASALGAYASALDGIKPDLDALRAEAETFRAEALQGYEEHYTPSVMAVGVIGLGERTLEKAGVIDKRHVEWQNHKPAFNKNNDLLMRLDEILRRINQAENDCTDALLAIAGENTGVAYVPTEDLPEGAFVGTDKNGKSLPWGGVGAYKPSNCAEGAYWAVNDFGYGMGAMVGVTVDYDGVHWGWDTVGNTWGGLANVLGSLAFVAATPPGSAVNLATGDDPYSKFGRERANVALGFLGGLVGLDYQNGIASVAAGEGFWHGATVNYRNDGGGTSTMMVLNIASLFVPVKGATALGRGAAASRILRIAEAVGLDRRLGAALGGSARVLSGELRLSSLVNPLGKSGLPNMLRLGDDAARVADNAAGAADNVAGVADNVAGAADNVAGAADNVAGAADNVAGAADNAAAATDNAAGAADAAANPGPPLTFKNSPYAEQFLDQIQIGPDGKPHFPGDPPGTFRTPTGQLHDGAQFVKDAAWADFKSKLDGPVHGAELSDPTMVEVPKSSSGDIATAEAASDAAKATQKAIEAETRATLDKVGLGDVKLSDLSASRVKDTLRTKGRFLSFAERDALERLAQELSSSKGVVTSAGEHVGVVGGRAGADAMGIQRADLPGAGYPGPYALDDIGQLNGNFVSMEYKGLSAKLDTTPVTLADGTRAVQGSPAYVADRMVKDPKVARYFRDNPELWARVKSGQSVPEHYVFSTKAGGQVSVRSCKVPLSEKQIAAIGEAIQRLS